MISFRALHRTGVGLRSNRPALRATYTFTRTMAVGANGDLNNTAAARSAIEVKADSAYRHVSIAIPPTQDDPVVRSEYRPFLHDGHAGEQDWVSELELSTVLKMVDTQVLQAGSDRLRVLVLYGSLRSR